MTKLCALQGILFHWCPQRGKEGRPSLQQSQVGNGEPETAILNQTSLLGPFLLTLRSRGPQVLCFALTTWPCVTFVILFAKCFLCLFLLESFTSCSSFVSDNHLSDLWMAVTAKLQSVWPLKYMVVCGFLLFLWCRYWKWLSFVGRSRTVRKPSSAHNASVISEHPENLQSSSGLSISCKCPDGLGKLPYSSTKETENPPVNTQGLLHSVSGLSSEVQRPVRQTAYVGLSWKQICNNNQFATLSSYP